MSNANYQVGYRAERRAGEVLKDWGFEVIRSGKSGGPFDLVGYNATSFILIQVKSCQFGDLKKYRKVKEELAKIKVPANCRKELWVYERRRGFHYLPID